VRRDSIACVADARSYALLDIDRQLKIPLMSISSLDEPQPGSVFGQPQDIATAAGGSLSRSSSSATAHPPSHVHSHSRSTSFGDFISGMRRPDRRPSEPEEPVFQAPDAPTPSRSPAPADKPLPAPPRDGADPSPPQATGSAPPRAGTPPVRATPSPKPGSAPLKPHILSPTPEEFLLVTGTTPLDPGIGMFVNLDGDPTRPTLEFARYPKEIVVDNNANPPSTPASSRPPQVEESFVLASMTRDFEDGTHHGLEIQRFDASVGEDEPEKWWLDICDMSSKKLPTNTPVGVRLLLQSEEVVFDDVVDRLSQRRFTPFKGPPETPTASLRRTDSRTALSLRRLSEEQQLFDQSDDETLPPGWEETRNQEAEEFVRQLAKTSSRLAIWAGPDIWWGVRNPLLLQLDAVLDSAATQPGTVESRHQLLTLLESIRDREPTTELEFMTLGYVRQKASVMLLATFLNCPEPPFSDLERQAMEVNLLNGDLDPRVVLSLIPALRNEIVVKTRGIWIYGGVKTLVDSYIAMGSEEVVTPSICTLSPPVLQFLRRFLLAWRKKKGFGSISDEVFRTVDACLLLVLLELDKDTPPGQTGKPGTVRKELYDLVDHGVDCFDRAVSLLESYHRLFVLSRLYQHRKMIADVLATWKRIIEGEEDKGGELGDGELRLRNYLSNISNQALVQEYGLWLASRNPKLGVQVFTDEKSKAPKFQHSQVVALLRAEAPGAVKYYLEHLVFGKGNTSYVNELITYYLDIVIADLQSSPVSCENIAASYDTYRALQPPKPTYLRFLTDNAPPDNEAWQARLRLLQLLGGGHDYDADAIRQRIDTLTFPLSANNDDQQPQQTDSFTFTTHYPSHLLVPEAIILAARASNHATALHLLVHRLGDYDTAVSYCLRGSGALLPATTVHTATGGPSASVQKALPPTWADQCALFNTLLRSLLSLPDEGGERLAQTSALLERFGAWFDVLEVLPLLPDEWPVESVAEFLVSALRRLVAERRQAEIERAMRAVEGLRVGAEFVEVVREKGAVVVEEDGVEQRVRIES